MSLRVAHITTVDMSLRYLLLDQMHSIQQVGYEVIGVSSPGPDVPIIEAGGIRHIAIPMTRSFTPISDLISLFRLYRMMRRERFTIVHTHNPKPGLLGQLAARMAGVPIVINTLHGFYFHEQMHPIWRHFYIVMEKIAARCSDVILSQNQEDIKAAVREGICSPDKIKYLGNGVDLQRFARHRVDTDLLERKRGEFGLPPRTPVVGFVGRLVAEKGLVELLQAAKLVKECIPTVRFLIIGPTDSEKPDALTPQIAAQYGVADVCTFTGMRQDMPELYALMDIFVLPSHREGLPRSPMEASAMGVPCIVTDIRGCREVVEHSRNGLRVPLGDALALSAAIMELLRDPGKAKRMGDEGRRLAEERFDQRATFEKIKAEYARLLLGKGYTVPVSRGQPFAQRDFSLVSGYDAYLRRLIDLIIAGCAFILLSPLIVSIALMVRVMLGSPVLFRQQRPGLHAKAFTLFKFRTMTDACNAQGSLLPDVDRLTSVGRFLRSTSLDELPELFNVLRGEMSLVGPRPLLMQYLERYTPEQMRRHDVKPGITGWAQVNGRNALTWEQKFALDLWYIDHQSLWLDLRIMALTVWRILRREGISEPGQATAREFMGSDS